jgi:4-amino-4-deoxy-L-arabinose transferase-like glycosyltransferase
MNQSSEKKKAPPWIWLTLLAVACVVRGGWLWRSLEDLRADDDSYRRLAINLMETGTFGYRIDGGPVRPTAFRPPFYPLLLAGVGRFANLGPGVVALVHFAMGVGTVALVYVIGKSWQLGRWSVAAALAAACDPILLRQSALVMTETTATFLAALALASLSRLDVNPTRRTAALSGAVVACAVLCRPTFLIWFGAIILALALLPSTTVRKRAGVAGTFLLAGGLIIALWAGRNYRTFHRPVIATTHGGYTLLLGNNEGFYRYLAEADWGEIWDSQDLDREYNKIKARSGHDEVAADRWAYNRAWTCIRSQPGMFLWSCVVRVGRLWGVLPHQIDADESIGMRLQRYAVGIWYGGIFLLVVMGTFALRRDLLGRPYLWGLLLCLCFILVHAFYWSNLRMRAPLMPVICLLAAGGARWIVRSVQKGSREKVDQRHANPRQRPIANHLFV